VGQARAITPLLPVALEGPAYFVSYGGAKFPELVIVLQGDNVTLDVHGETFINKAGITSSTFKAIPDAPVGSFELTLPEGKYWTNGANGESVVNAVIGKNAHCASGGAEFKVGGSAAYACNGAAGPAGPTGPTGSPWTAGGTLPHGASEMG
jgi:hypothetical protein